MDGFTPHQDRRLALVSGGSSGIGAATAEALAGIGHPVAIGARRIERCAPIAETIRAKGGEVFAHPLDVTEPDSIEEFVGAAERALGPAEILVASAGEIEFSPVHAMDPERFLRQVQLHLGGAQRLVHQVLPGMLRRQRGDVVLISSDSALAPRPWMGAYSAAKAGLEAMAQAMRMELEGTGIRTCVVRPGPTATGMGTDTDPQILGPLLQDWTAWGFFRHMNMVPASDVAAAVVAVVSMPRGSHLVLAEVQPEAPVRPPGSTA
ncbi:SDR family oxidoreductase [Nocardia sp. CNY236]|uniref:SDR family oxidoreductase n=1 Tax=Nocardia sp. CNY236 TaxID=1169152 RepID=UPI0004050841|nr:SDR family oxidoreductase [Nocardia sp. CNY236]